MEKQKFEENVIEKSFEKKTEINFWNQRRKIYLKQKNRDEGED